MVDCHIGLPLGDVRIKELCARDLPINLESEFSVQAYPRFHGKIPGKQGLGKQETHVSAEF